MIEEPEKPLTAAEDMARTAIAVLIENNKRLLHRVKEMDNVWSAYDTQMAMYHRRRDHNAMYATWKQFRDELGGNQLKKKS